MPRLWYCVRRHTLGMLQTGAEILWQQFRLTGDNVAMQTIQQQRTLGCILMWSQTTLPQQYLRISSSIGLELNCLNTTLSQH